MSSGRETEASYMKTRATCAPSCRAILTCSTGLRFVRVCPYVPERAHEQARERDRETVYVCAAYNLET